MSDLNQNISDAGVEQNNQTPNNLLNSEANLKSVIASAPNLSKKGSKKIIFTILGLVIIVGGIVGGMQLVQSRQEVEKKAYDNSSTGGVRAVCGDIKVYDANWKLISKSELEKFEPEDMIRFSVECEASSGSFDKARFNINDLLTPEVITKRPESNEFYYEYTIPDDVKTFDVKAEVHHSELGWF